MKEVYKVNSLPHTLLLDAVIDDDMEPDSYRRLSHTWNGRGGVWYGLRWLKSATLLLDVTKSFTLHPLKAFRNQTNKSHSETVMDKVKSITAHYCVISCSYVSHCVTRFIQVAC